MFGELSIGPALARPPAVHDPVCSSSGQAADCHTVATLVAPSAGVLAHRGGEADHAGAVVDGAVEAAQRAGRAAEHEVGVQGDAAGPGAEASGADR
ncbi:hypothetical protein ACFQY4_37495 [Catellatospora bangladeshensis]|uniref:hypothetical protein n=1 Tax=Catellatospora bangladeshensis TaxID=310355 RepID=UPI001943B957|nr:hypothetical protein [Catellatospora bangladeshensis]